MNDEVERELMKIEAIADVLATVDAGELARHTAAGLGAIILEACLKVRDCVEGKKV